MAKLTSKMVYEFLKEKYGIGITKYSTLPVSNNEYKKRQKMYYCAEENNKQDLDLKHKNKMLFRVAEPKNTEKCEVVADVLSVRLITTETEHLMNAATANGEEVDPPIFDPLHWQMFLMEKDANFATDIIKKAEAERHISILTKGVLDENSKNYKEDCQILDREVFEYNSYILQAQKFIESRKAAEPNR